MFNGMPGYVPIYAILTFANYQVLGTPSLQNILAQGLVLQILAYPFMTAQRRMEA